MSTRQEKKIDRSIDQVTMPGIQLKVGDEIKVHVKFPFGNVPGEGWFACQVLAASDRSNSNIFVGRLKRISRQVATDKLTKKMHNWSPEVIDTIVKLIDIISSEKDYHCCLLGASRPAGRFGPSISDTLCRHLKTFDDACHGKGYDCFQEYRDIFNHHYEKDQRLIQHFLCLPSLVSNLDDATIAPVSGCSAGSFNLVTSKGSTDISVLDKIGNYTVSVSGHIDITSIERM